MDMKLGTIVTEIDNRQRKMEVDFATHQEYTKQMLSAILEQTKKTNGNVTTNTKDITVLNAWRSKMRGVWFTVVIIAVSISTIASLAIALYHK
jgi:hypothetical protein